jgi:hypothetical protein
LGHLGRLRRDAFHPVVLVVDREIADGIDVPPEVDERTAEPHGVLHEMEHLRRGALLDHVVELGTVSWDVQVAA